MAPSSVLVLIAQVHEATRITTGPRSLVLLGLIAAQAVSGIVYSGQQMFTFADFLPRKIVSMLPAK